jgi:hypothetical protein
MPDTDYTKGFKAGLDWNRERTIKLLEELLDGLKGEVNAGIKS